MDTIKNDPVNWKRKALKLAFFIILKPKVPNLDVADMTNENADGLVEFKSYGDFVGSTTGKESHRLEEQAIKMYSTGIPSAIVIYGDRLAYQMVSGVDDSLIMQAHQKLMTIQAVFKIPVHQVKNPSEAIEVAKTFIRHCNQYPRRLPIYSLLKREGPLAVLVGYELVAEKTASKIWQAWESIDKLMEFLIKNRPSMEQEKLAEMVKEKTPGLRIDQAKVIVRVTFQKHI